MRSRIGELHEALSRRGLDAAALEARALGGLEGRSAVDGDLAALLKDPLAGLTRTLESRQSSLDGRSDGERQMRQEAQRDSGRFRDPSQREQDKEDRK